MLCRSARLEKCECVKSQADSPERNRWLLMKLWTNASFSLPGPAGCGQVVL